MVDTKLHPREWSYMQGNQTKSDSIDARPPLAVLNYILDQACLSYQGGHCSPTDLCLRATHDSHF